MILASQMTFPFWFQFFLLEFIQTKSSFSRVNKTISLQFFLIWVFINELHMFSNTQVSTSTLNVILETTHRNLDVPQTSGTGDTSLLSNSKFTVVHPKIIAAPMTVKPTSDVHWVFIAKQFQDLFLCTTDKTGSPIHCWASYLL